MHVLIDRIFYTFSVHFSSFNTIKTLSEKVFIHNIFKLNFISEIKIFSQNYKQAAMLECDRTTPLGPVASFPVLHPGILRAIIANLSDRSVNVSSELKQIVSP